MKTPTLTRAALLTLALVPQASAQGWMTPATSSAQLQTAQPQMAQPQAATQSSAAVIRPDGTSYVMPISLDLLPYGTVELSPNTYMIQNYENTGVTIMIYAPKPLRIATYAEMMGFQAQYAQLVRTVTGNPVTGNPVASTSGQGQLPSAAALMQQAPSAAPAQYAAPQAAPAQPTTPAPQPAYTPPVSPVQPAAPQLASAPASGPIFTDATVSWAPQQTAAPQAQAALAPTVSAAPQPRDAQAPSALPDFLKGSFTGRALKNGSYQISYSVVNRSRTITARLSPQDLRVNQGGAYLAARLDARDSSGEPTMIPPQAGQIGTVTFNQRGSTPVTLEWLVRDLTNGLTYPVRYTWQPSSNAQLGSAVR